MSYFLWIEDFENSAKATASDVLGSIFDDNQFAEDKRALKRNLKSQGVFIELSFQDGLGFIRQNLNKIDYVILDIDLRAYTDEINDDVLKLLTDFQGYKKLEDETEDEALLTRECNRLKEIAGFYLYTELIVELGFPKQHILFCSNHGENTLTIQDAFKAAKIALPQIYQKSDSFVKDWVKTRYENPYSKLRRGIIEGCQKILELVKNEEEDEAKRKEKENELTQKYLRFNHFIKEKQVNLDEIRDYLEILENFLPLQEPNNKTRFYKLFVRTLAHEWEAAEPETIRRQKSQDKKQQDLLFVFARIMKTSRNWLAHSKIFEQLQAQDVAYLFIINMRAMFDLGDELLPYEKQLLSLFNEVSISEFKILIGDDAKNRKIPLIENYAKLLKNTGNTWQAVNFHDALNNLQKNKEAEIDASEFIKGLYQMFWFITSNGQVYIPSDDEQIKRFSVLNYQFRYFDYHKDKQDYLFELARHIYNRSFS